ncbi:GNAT family N-acetyltransferase [Bacteroidales bacterium OttesenSCG-928-B11]|nr:GNAT family N-acetyltransferase [Bacteroidales bacterium OttesenSCG-928-C03]MDL2311834.1 GNAT family N-acetyltransferase [Bacteroidales bacterium OttesenSCG-928-B11]MDL2325516.1 GNAT family N-acetyltransferase [Bacteroidales bacterium OttesenSCG-928-A14]
MFNNNEEVLVIKVDEDIELKQVEQSDAPELYSLIDQNRAYFSRWLPFVHYTVGVENHEEVVITMVNVANLMPKYVFAIKYQGEYVGLLAFRNFDEINRKADLNFWLSKLYHKRGIMFRSVLALMDYAYYNMDVNKISIKSPIGNYASSNIPRRIGFQLEGIERAGERMADESYIDLEVYGMLRDEYEKIRFQ